MDRLIVSGGKRLIGEVHVSGSKNAALPIIFACITVRGVSRIENLPDIGDVRVALSIIEGLGAKIHREQSVTYVDTTLLEYLCPSEKEVAQIRASTYLIGSCLSRFGTCRISAFGGCNFANRPIDMHLDAAIKMGASMDGDILSAKKIRGCDILFRVPSVGATVNAILLACAASGSTHLYGCAVEPHIDVLIAFINSCGGKIRRVGTEILIEGRPLHGGNIRIIGDMIEAGSYACAGLMTDGEIVIKGAPTDDMCSVIEALRLLGAEVFALGDELRVGGCSVGRKITITAMPHPEFPTDLQPVFAPVMAKFSGGMIIDNVWHSRFGYLDSLASFGIKSRRENNSAEIYSSKIVNSAVAAPDLRGGFACLITALSAEGESQIYSPEIILRGYERASEKLSALGAETRLI